MGVDYRLLDHFHESHHREAVRREVRELRRAGAHPGAGHEAVLPGQAGAYGADRREGAGRFHPSSPRGFSIDDR